MTRNETITTLQREAGDFRDGGVIAMYLFGSIARNQARSSSDVDLFVDYDPERFDFVELIRLRDRLSSVLGRPADLTTRQGLHPLLREKIEAEAIRVF